jgi:Domain of unknown function (DUF4129)
LRKLSPVERIYQQMLAKLGIPKHPAQTQLEYAQTVRDTRSSSISSLVTEISQAYTAWRYGAEAQRLDRLQELLTHLKKEKMQ